MMTAYYKYCIFCALAFILLAECGHGNVKYIDYSKIDPTGKYSDEFKYICDNARYADHWAAKWQYEVKKNDLVTGLKKCHSIFSSLPKKNHETYLLLAELSQFLYNLEQEDYYDSSFHYYNTAIQSDTADYRGWWFLGNYCVFAGQQVNSIIMFKYAEKIGPAIIPADFYDEFAVSAYTAAMFSTVNYCFQKAREIRGYPGDTEKAHSQLLWSKVNVPNPDSLYSHERLWSVNKKAEYRLISRPLGLKVIADTNCDISLSALEGGMCNVVIESAPLAASNDILIKYTTALICKIPESGETIDEFIDEITGKWGRPVKLVSPVNYEGSSAYEFADTTVYRENGMGKLFLVAIERPMPKYPGLLIEEPQNPLGTENGGSFTYVATNNCLNRFTGKIFYLFLLDSCGDIYKQARHDFISFLNNKVVIE